MTHTLTITTEEIEMIYFSLTDYFLKYANRSKTYENLDGLLANGGNDYEGDRAKEILNLQDRFGEIMFDTKKTNDNENIATI